VYLDAVAKVDSFAVYSAFVRCDRSPGTRHNHDSSPTRRSCGSKTVVATFFANHGSRLSKDTGHPCHEYSLPWVEQEAVAGYRVDQLVHGRIFVVEVRCLEVGQIPHEVRLSLLALQSVNENGGSCNRDFHSD
jgi:hypothetical protein